MLDLKNISKTFNPGTVNAKKAISALSLHLDNGDFVTIIGSNGAGKSTLMSVLFGLYQPEEGVIKVKGSEVKIKGPLDANAQPLHRPLIPGPPKRHSPHHDHRRKHGLGLPAQHRRLLPFQPNLQKR